MEFLQNRTTPPTGSEKAVVALFRDILGNPFRPMPVIDPAWLAWRGGLVPDMAQTIYDQKDFTGLPILADVLEESGCDNADMLGHLRSAASHAKGCWVLDLLLGKE